MDRVAYVSTTVGGKFMVMASVAGSAQIASPPAEVRVQTAGSARFPAPLAEMLGAVAHAASGATACRDENVAAALAPYMGRTGLLDGVACAEGLDKYTRHLLFAGTAYCVLALVWRPRQMSPVHAHRAWCVFGVHQGWMTETVFTRGTTDVRPIACVPRCTGDTAYAPADPDKIHRLANLGTMNALTIHVYGSNYDRLGQDVNEIWSE